MKCRVARQPAACLEPHNIFSNAGLHFRILRSQFAHRTATISNPFWPAFRCIALFFEPSNPIWHGSSGARPAPLGHEPSAMSNEPASMHQASHQSSSSYQALGWHGGETIRIICLVHFQIFRTSCCFSIPSEQSWEIM